MDELTWIAKKSSSQWEDLEPLCQGRGRKGIVLSRIMESLLGLPARSAAPHRFVLQGKTQIIPNHEDTADTNHFIITISRFYHKCNAVNTMRSLQATFNPKNINTKWERLLAFLYTVSFCSLWTAVDFFSQNQCSEGLL